MSKVVERVVERAQHGQAEAIAILLNRYFKPQGIAASVFHEEHRLQVTLDSMDAPDPQRTLRWLLPTLENLHPEGVSMIQIMARRAGEKSAAWVETFTVQDKRLIAIDAKTPGQNLYIKGDLVPLAQKGDLSAIQAFVDQAVGNPNLRAHVALTTPVLKITIQTIQFLDGQNFAAELAEKLKAIASYRIQVIEIYKQKIVNSQPFLLYRVQMNR